MNNEEAYEKLMALREKAYDALRGLMMKRSEINQDIEKARKLIDEIDAEIRRVIEI